jgi:hypothetical protein
MRGRDGHIAAADRLMLRPVSKGRTSLVRRCLAAIVVCAVWLGAGPPQAVAASLSKEECDKLHADQAELTAAGVREQFDRGAEWGKTNLPPDQLQRVQRFIGNEEQLSFRCGLAKLRVILPVTEEGGEQELDEKGNPIPPKVAPADGSATKSTAKAAPKAKQPVKAKDGKSLEGAAAAAAGGKPKPKAPSEVKDKTAGETQAKPTAAKAPKPRPKPDDAYRPPVGSTSTGDPFAAQKATPPKQ